MRITAKAIDDELQRLGHEVHVEKGDEYFYFWGAEANDWLDKTVRGSTLGSLTLEQWVAEFNRLKRFNQELLGGKAKPKGAKKPKIASKP